MKLRQPFVVVTIVPATAANNSRRHRRTLSATAKKPASVAGFLFLKLNFAFRSTLFLPLATPSHQSHLLKLITQTPSSF